MATQLFMQPIASGTELRLTPLSSAEGQLLTTRGGGVVASGNVSTVTGPVTANQVQVKTGSSQYTWFSQEVSTSFTISGTITCNIWASESNMSANAAIGCTIERIGQFGETISTIAQGSATAELAVTTRSANNFTLTPTSTSMVPGDRIRVTMYIDDPSASTMASGFTCNASWGGTSAAADGDSYVTFTETFGFALPAAGPSLLASTPTSSASASSISVTLPTGYGSGDLLVAAIGFGRVTSGATTLNAPSGWAIAVQREGVNGDQEHGVGVIWKIASGSEGSSVSVSVTGASAIRAIALAYDAGTFDSTDPIGNTVDAEDADGSDGIPIPSIVVGRDGNNVICVGHSHSMGTPAYTGCNTHRVSGRTNVAYDVFGVAAGGGVGGVFLWTQAKIAAGTASTLAYNEIATANAYQVVALEINAPPAAADRVPPPRLYSQLLAH